MKYLTDIHQYGWNFVLSGLYDTDDTIELKCNSFKYKIYDHKNMCWFIFGDKGKYKKKSEYFENDIDNIIDKTAKQKSISIKSGVMCVIPKQLYKNENILNLVTNVEGFNGSVFHNVNNGNTYNTFISSMAYNSSNNYLSSFDFGVIKNFGKPLEVKVLKCSNIGGFCIMYDYENYRGLQE